MNSTTKIVAAILALYPRNWVSNIAPLDATHAAAMLAKRGVELVGAPEWERAALWAVFLSTRAALSPAPGSLAEALLLAASNAADAASGEISVGHADERSEETLLAALARAAVRP